MKNKAAVVGGVLLVWHLLSLIKDAERWQFNLARYQARPTGANLVKLLVAEGMLISDLRWL